MDKPTRIYLQFDESGEFPEWEGVTWCSDRINDSDIEYVVAVQVKELEATLSLCLEYVEDPENSPISRVELEDKLRKILDD